MLGNVQVSKEAVALQLNESWWREYQVLPGRDTPWHDDIWHWRLCPVRDQSCTVTCFGQHSCFTTRLCSIGNCCS